MQTENNKPTMPEYQRAYYLRTKYPEDKDMSIPDILAKYPKPIPLTPAQRMRKSREKDRRKLHSLVSILLDEVTKINNNT